MGLLHEADRQLKGIERRVMSANGRVDAVPGLLKPETVSAAISERMDKVKAGGFELSATEKADPEGDDLAALEVASYPHVCGILRKEAATAYREAIDRTQNVIAILQPLNAIGLEKIRGLKAELETKLATLVHSTEDAVQVAMDAQTDIGSKYSRLMEGISKIGFDSIDRNLHEYTAAFKDAYRAIKPVMNIPKDYSVRVFQANGDNWKKSHEEAYKVWKKADKNKSKRSVSTVYTLGWKKGGKVAYKAPEYKVKPSMVANSEKLEKLVLLADRARERQEQYQQAQSFCRKEDGMAPVFEECMDKLTQYMIDSYRHYFEQVTEQSEQAVEMMKRQSELMQSHMVAVK